MEYNQKLIDANRRRQRQEDTGWGFYDNPNPFGKSKVSSRVKNSGYAKTLAKLANAQNSFIEDIGNVKRDSDFNRNQSAVSKLVNTYERQRKAERQGNVSVPRGKVPRVNYKASETSEQRFARKDARAQQGKFSLSLTPGEARRAAVDNSEIFTIGGDPSDLNYDLQYSFNPSRIDDAYEDKRSQLFSDPITEGLSIGHEESKMVEKDNYPIVPQSSSYKRGTNATQQERKSDMSKQLSLRTASQTEKNANQTSDRRSYYKQFKSASREVANRLGRGLVTAGGQIASRAGIAYRDGTNYLNRVYSTASRNSAAGRIDKYSISGSLLMRDRQQEQRYWRQGGRIVPRAGSVAIGNNSSLGRLGTVSAYGIGSALGTGIALALQYIGPKIIDSFRTEKQRYVNDLENGNVTIDLGGGAQIRLFYGKYIYPGEYDPRNNKVMWQGEIWDGTGVYNPLFYGNINKKILPENFDPLVFKDMSYEDFLLFLRANFSDSAVVDRAVAQNFSGRPAAELDAFQHSNYYPDARWAGNNTIYWLPGGLRISPYNIMGDNQYSARLMDLKTGKVIEIPFSGFDLNTVVIDNDDSATVARKLIALIIQNGVNLSLMDRQYLENYVQQFGSNYLAYSAPLGYDNNTPAVNPTGSARPRAIVQVGLKYYYYVQMPSGKTYPLLLVGYDPNKQYSEVELRQIIDNSRNSDQSMKDGINVDPKSGQYSYKFADGRVIHFDPSQIKVIVLNGKEYVVPLVGPDVKYGPIPVDDWFKTRPKGPLDDGHFTVKRKFSLISTDSRIKGGTAAKRLRSEGNYLQNLIK